MEYFPKDMIKLNRYQPMNIQQNSMFKLWRAFSRDSPKQRSFDT